MTGLKYCYRCKETKPITEFNKDRSKKDGHNDECRVCRAASKKIYRQKYKSKILEDKRQYRVQNRAKEKARKVEYEARKLGATPIWADRKEISLFYEAALAFRMYTGLEYHVDHVVPLKSERVCGLHCEDNLQVLEAKENMKKSNRFWPDMP